MISDQVLNYKLYNKIGEGGMGSVYLAFHTQLNRKAAIKVLHPRYVNNAHIKERFKNEASTLAHLRHPNIVSLYDYLESPQGLFLIMEYVEGKPLDEYIRLISGPIPEVKAIRIFSQILDGFEYAHSQGVIHRDIKPSNLMITTDGEVKILDFGIAKLLRQNNRQLTGAGARLGTILYMSPEQVKGQELDHRSDIYSLGLTLFQMLTGRGPYDDLAVNEYEIYNHILHQPLPKAQKFYPTVSQRMQAILDKATAKQPQKRFQSCGEFVQALIGPSDPPPVLAKSRRNSLHRGRLQEISKPIEEAYLYSDEEPSDTLPQSDGGVWFLPTIFFLLLMSAGLMLIFWNPLDMELLRPYEMNTSQSYSVAQDSPELVIQERISAFYEAVESQDFTLVAPFYRQKIDNYYGNLDRNRSPDIRAAYKISWETYIDERHDIDWSSFAYQRDKLGNHIIRFEMQYYYRTPGEAWKKLKRKTEVRLDENLEIFYINTL